MGAPATQGRLCTKLDEMEIGDYIRCTYTAPTANVAGEFSNLGGAVVETKELSTTPIETPNGYFYYLKVDKGLLVADRMVQSEISYHQLYLAGFILGHMESYGAIRVLSSSECIKYLGKSNLNGLIITKDNKVWNGRINSIGLEEVFSKYGGGYSINLEVSQSIKKGEFRAIYDLADLSYDSAYHVQSDCGFNEPALVSKYQSMQINSGKNLGRQTTITCTICFRPVLEYIDNAKSKTFWY